MSFGPDARPSKTFRFLQICAGGYGRRADNARSASDVRSRRIADVADRGLGRLNWVESGLSTRDNRGLSASLNPPDFQPEFAVANILNTGEKGENHGGENLSPKFNCIKIFS